MGICYASAKGFFSTYPWMLGNVCKAPFSDEDDFGFGFGGCTWGTTCERKHGGLSEQCRGRRRKGIWETTRTDFSWQLCNVPPKIKGKLPQKRKYINHNKLETSMAAEGGDKDKTARRTTSSNKITANNIRKHKYKHQLTIPTSIV